MVNNMRKDFKPKISACRKKNGEINSDFDEILERQKEHFKDLLDAEELVMDEEKQQRQGKKILQQATAKKMRNCQPQKK